MTNDIAGRTSSCGQPSAAAPGAKRAECARERKKKRLFLEILEPRLVLSQITWNATASPTGGDWDLGSNWIGGNVPIAGDTAIIQGLTSPGTVYLDSNKADTVSGLTTDSSTTLEVVNGSLTIGASSSSSLGGPVNVDKGAALGVGASASVTIGAGQTFTDNGSLTFATGDSVSFPTAELATTQIVVNGSLSATGTNFINPGNVANSLNQIYVGTDGEVKASGSTFGVNQLYLTTNSTLIASDLTSDIFNATIYAPVLDVPLLAANKSFEDIDILGGSLSNGQKVSLSPLGTVTTVNQRYVFPSAFTVGAGATLNVEPGASVLIRDSEQLEVDGTLNITSASSFEIEDFDDGGESGGIMVYGAITITNTSLTLAGGTNGDDTTFLQVNSGAQVTMTGSTFAWDQLLLNSGASTISITGDDFSNVGALGIISSGVPDTDIPLAYNYWGTSDSTLIQAKILDNGNLPTVIYQPFVNATTTSANPAQASFGNTNQTVDLSASISTPAGVVIDAGTVTFTILNGTHVIGQATAPVVVSKGTATADYTLPANTPIGKYIIDASYSGTDLYLSSTDTTQFLTVTAAAIDQLVIHTQPSTTATAGQPFAVQPVIYVEDKFGNLETSDNTTVVTVSLATGTGMLEGTKQVTVTGGVATFLDLSYNTAEIISLNFAGASLKVGPSTNITVSNAAPYQLVIHTQPSSTATAGQAFDTQPVIYELDQYGNLETGDNSTMITATLASGNGTLRGTTTATLSGGVASFVGLADNTAGIISLNFAGGGFTAGPSNNIFINPGPATQLVIQTPPYTMVTAGNPLTDPIVIAEEDQYDNIETGDNSTVVTASLNSGGGTLNGTTTATVVNGVASFNDIEDDKAGKLALQFTAPSLPAVVAPTSTVMPAAAMTVVVNRPPSGVIAGIKFGLSVNTNDNYGNLATSYNGPVTVALASGSSGALSGTTTVMAAGGVADFTDLVDTTSGPASLDVTSGSLTQATTPATVSPGPASQLVIQVQPSRSATAGVPFATQPVVAEEDQYNNVVTSDNSTVVTAYLGSGAGSLQGTVTATLADGVATFVGQNDTTAGTITLQFKGGGFTSAASLPILVSPAAAAKLVLQSQPSATATAGQAFATQPVLELEDQYNNVETGDNTSMIAAVLASGTGPLQGTTTVKVKGGVATFSGLADQLVETITLAFSDGGFTAGPSTVVISPAAAGKLVIQTEPSATATAGQPFATQPVILLEDQYGNLETGDNSTVITAVPSSGTRSLKGATATVKAGVATFTTLEDDTAGTTSLRFTHGSLASPPSSSIVVSAAAFAQLVVVPQSGSVTAGVGFQITVEAQDEFGNVVPSFKGDVTVGLAQNSSGESLSGTLTAPAVAGIATFTGLTLDNPGGTYTLQVSGGGLVSEAPPKQVTPAPTVTGEAVAMTPKTKKRKSVFTGFTIHYSAPMSSSAVILANYKLDAITIKRGKKKPTPVKFGASIDPTDQIVTLTVKGKNPFAKGGQLTIVASSSTGVSSQAGVLLNPSYTTFVISPNAKHITPAPIAILGRASV